MPEIKNVTRKTENPVDDVEKHSAYSYRSDVGGRAQMTYNSNINQAQQRNCNV